jgi:2-dehydro-3-deoxyglucarate aldolase
MVNSKETAESVVAAVKYPPNGHRSYGLARAQRYGHQFDDYISWNQTGSMVIVQVEHIDAVENLEEILGVEGVDGYFVGPYDLSGSLGIPGEFSNPLFVSAMEEIKRISKKVGKPGGMHIIEPIEDSLREAIEQGYQFIAYSLDFKFLDTGCRKGLGLWSER